MRQRGSLGYFGLLSTFHFIQRYRYYLLRTSYRPGGTESRCAKERAYSNHRRDEHHAANNNKASFLWVVVDYDDGILGDFSYFVPEASGGAEQSLDS